MKKAVIYARVSTNEQAEEGQSIETQIKLCKKWAKENKVEIVKTYTDRGQSATNIKRPALQDMLSECGNDKTISYLLVQDTDRLARNTLDHLTIKSILKDNEIKIVSISQPIIDDSPEGNLIDTVLASVNAFQSQITGRKTSKVLEQKAKQGWFPGGIPPVGYKNTDNPKPKSSLDKRITKQDNDKAHYIKQAFKKYATGNYNLKELCKWLNKQGVTTTSNTPFRTSTVAYFLKNPFYIGKFRWKDEIYKGQHKPLVDKATYNKVQQILASHNQGGSRKRKHDFLLRGFLYCSDCDSRMWAEFHKKKNKKYGFYFCPKCKEGTYADNKEMETKVEKFFETIELSKDYTTHILKLAEDVLRETRKDISKEKELLNKRKSKIEAGVKETEDSRFIDKTIDEETFQKIHGRYKQQLEQVKSELESLDSDYSDKIETLEKVLRLAENIGTAYKKANQDLKRNYLKLFLEKIMVEETEISDFVLSSQLKPLIEEGSVRVSKVGLPGLDSNQRPAD